MVLVANLVPPAAKPSSGPDIALLQLRQQLLQHAFAFEAGRGIAVVEAAVVDGDDFVLWHEHLCVDETLDAVLDEILVVDGLHGGFGDFEHDGPVVAWSRFG